MWAFAVRCASPGTIATRREHELRLSRWLESEGPLHRILLVFIDGLGLGPDVSGNPLASPALDNVRAFAGAALTEPQFESAIAGSNPMQSAARLDAVLGVEGLPQSGTGQTSLYSGRNAQRLAGRHVPALPSRDLRQLLERGSIFHLEQGNGGRPCVAFANAFTSTYLARVRRGDVRTSAALAAAWSAGVRLRDELDLERERAVSWDLTGDHFGVPLPALRNGPRGERWRRGMSRPETSRVEPEEAASRLLGLAVDHRLTVFETYLADLAGHGRFMIDADRALVLLDSLLGALLRSRPSGVTIVVTSDHGNIEDLTRAQHTRNQVPLIACGPAASTFAGASRIDEVRWRIERALALSGDAPTAQTHG